jgi:hypothetical protein
LQDDEGKVGLGIHVAGHVLNFFDLSLDAVVDPFEEAIGWPAGYCQGQGKRSTCWRSAYTMRVVLNLL